MSDRAKAYMNDPIAFEDMDAIMSTAKTEGGLSYFFMN